jgi:hypothetical protein
MLALSARILSLVFVWSKHYSHGVVLCLLETSNLLSDVQENYTSTRKALIRTKLCFVCNLFENYKRLHEDLDFQINRLSIIIFCLPLYMASNGRGISCAHLFVLDPSCKPTAGNNILQDFHFIPAVSIKSLRGLHYWSRLLVLTARMYWSYWG